MPPSPPLPVTEDTPPDMLAGSMDLRVVLPNNHSVKMSVERSTPMMDLLVQVTTANKISPGGHVIQAVGDKCILPYKPSTPIGALDTWTIQIVPKTKAFGNLPLKKAPLKPNNQQPFEQTFRLQVHLPRNQLFVTRVGSKTLLSDILYLACNEKNLDTSKYELRHPANLEERLQLSCTLADYKLQEVVMVAKSRPMGAALSSADIMALHKEEEKRRQQAKAGGTRFFGAVFKRNRSTMGEGSVSSDSLGGRSISPARSDESASRSASPPTPNLPPMIVQPPPRPQRKRRPAPKPPTPNNMEQVVDKQSCSQGNTKDSLKLSHSRNSSDSSGYHEASVLSESPDTHSATIQGSAETLPRRSKLPSAHPLPNGQPSQGSHLSRSLSNLTAMSGGHVRSLHSASTSALSTAGQGMKKKKAAPPPPKVRAIPDLQEEPGHGDRSSTLPSKARRSRQERGLGNTASLENVSSFAQAKSPSLGSSSSSSSVTCNGDDHLEEIVEDVANVMPDASSLVSVSHLGGRPCSSSDVEAAVTPNHSSLNGSCKPSSNSDISVTSNFQIINSGRKHSSSSDVDVAINTSRKHSNSSSVVEAVTSTHPSINGSRKHSSSNDEDTGLIMVRKYTNSSNVDTPVISSNAGININRQHSSSSDAGIKISSNVDTQVTSTNVGVSISPKHSSSKDVDASINIGHEPTSSRNVDAKVTSNNADVNIGLKHSDSSNIFAAVNTTKAGMNSSGQVTSHNTINMIADASSVERPACRDTDVPVPTPKPRTMMKLRSPLPTPRRLSTESSTSQSGSVDSPAPKPRVAPKPKLAGPRDNLDSDDDLVLTDQELERFDMGKETPSGSDWEMSTDFKHVNPFNGAPKNENCRGSSVSSFEVEHESITSSAFGYDDSEASDHSVAMPKVHGRMFKPRSDGNMKFQSLKGSFERNPFPSSASKWRTHKLGAGGDSVTSLRSFEDMPHFLSAGGNIGRWDNMESLVSDTMGSGSSLQSINKAQAGQPSAWVLGSEESEMEDKDEVDRAFQSVTDELEAAIIADEIKQSKEELRTHFDPVILPPLDLAPTSPFPSHPQDYICPGVDDWQYQLPAPPSAFRDANSPIPTEGGTIVLADTKVFQESTPSEDLSFVNEQSKMNEDYDSLRHRNKPSKAESISSHNEVERVNPIFDYERFEDVVQTKVSSEKYVQNHSQDSAQPQPKAKINSWASTNNNIDSVPNEVDMRRNSDTKTSSLSSESNSLNRYFTISAYQKPNDVDHIFDESSSDDNSTSGKASAAISFKKPYSVQRPSKKYGSTSSLVATNIARTNSFTSNANPSGFTPVKRSTSYVSLVHSSRQPKPSHSIPYSARTTSVGNLALEAEESSRVAAGLGKAYSQQNITKGIGNDDEERPQFQYSPRVLEDPPHHALQSLQVMRSILPQLKQTQTPVAVKIEKPALPDNSQMENPTHRSSTLPRSVRSGSVDTISSQQATEAQSNSEERRYSYRGPPAINLTTWTERPKIQVSIKNDRDYRTNCKQPEPQAKATVEPLTMRIVTLTTATGYKRSTSQEEPKTTVSFTKPVADVAKVSDPSRVPIVRAVELKKPFQAQKSSDNNGSFLRNGGGTDQADSHFAGVNSLAKRFSLGGVVRAKNSLNPRPVSAYDYVRNVENTESSRMAEETVIKMDPAPVKSTSTNNLNGSNAHWNSLSRTNSNSTGTRKYTSIVGINNSSSNSWDAPHQTGSSFVKVNGFGGIRQHMPVVKGFQFTSSTPNTSSVSVKVQSPPVEIVSSSKSKALPSLCTRKQDSAMPAVVKVEQSPAIVKVERPLGKPSTVTIRSSVPAPPPPTAPFLSGIVLKKSTLPRGKLLPPPEANPRDQLMDAIRKFGTQGNLKQVGVQSATTNVILKI